MSPYSSGIFASITVLISIVLDASLVSWLEYPRGAFTQAITLYWVVIAATRD